jgi:uncharacterized NAD-dependent epimerase/dehydratase family protein
MTILDKISMKPNAIILTGSKLATSDGKTAHGLLRGSSRFNIVGVIDKVDSGRDAGAVLDGVPRGIPVYATIQDFVDQSPDKAAYAIIGVALHGGLLPADWKPTVLSAIDNRMGIVNGLHQPLNEDPELQAAAARNNVELIDIRRPRPLEALRFWSGEIYSVKAPIIAVLGLDCAIGKRTTARFIADMCRDIGIRAEMIYTGQTGWMQGYRYGFILDATPNDFVCGELERAIVDCDRASSPDLILLEGQSSLRNPAGPCGAEFLLSGNAKGVILQHVPFRTYYEDLEGLECHLPKIEDEIALINLYGAQILAVTLNGEGGDRNELMDYQEQLADRLGLPVVRPLQEGVERLLPVIRRFLSQ